MANLLEWTFKLKDQISPGAKSAAGSLNSLLSTMHAGLASLDYLARGAMLVGESIGNLLAPAVSKEKTLGAFETMLGSATQSVDLYREAVDFANRTPFETPDIVASYKQLLAAQFQKEDLQTVVRIVGDAASMQEFPAEAMKGVNRALGQIKSKGKLSQEELNQVAEAVPLNQSMFLDNLAKLYGMNVQQVRALKEQGKIEGESGVYAILQTLQQQFGGNMEKASRQVDGLWSTIKSMPYTYLDRLMDTKGYDALRNSLAGVVAQLDPAGEHGKALGEFIEDMGSGVLERASVQMDYLVTGVLAFTEGLAAGLGPLGESFGPTNQNNLEKFRSTMEQVGTATGQLVGFFKDLADGLKTVWDYFSKIGKELSENEKFAGFLDKWVAPIFNMEQTTGTGAGTTQELLVGEKRNQERRTPVLSQIAGGAATFSVPAMADGGLVTRPTLALIGEKGPEMVTPASGGFMGGGDISVQFNYYGTGTRGDGEEIERKVEAGIRTALDRWALQSGRRG